MKQHKVGIIMNGVTGRMGTNQHLLRSIVEILKKGGVKGGNGDTIIPDPILVGRNEEKLKKLSDLSGIQKVTTNLDKVLSDPNYPIYFDAQTTARRFEAVEAAIAAGKHVYCEKPISSTSKEAVRLYDMAQKAGVKNGVVQDKLWLPGLVKLKRLIDSGSLGKLLSVRGEFGYWVFEGHDVVSQRPSWNYVKEEGGGIIIDMLCHWRYLLDNLFGEVKAVSCYGATHITERVDEAGQKYKCTADDAAYCTFQLENDVVAQINSSWSVRVRRDDLFTLQVDGMRGSAVAGLTKCYAQSYEQTPRMVWNPDIEQKSDFNDDWTEVDQGEVFDNAFKVQWELFLKHVVFDEPFRWNLLEGASGVQLAEKGIESWKEGRWVEIPKLR